MAHRKDYNYNPYASTKFPRMPLGL